MCFQALLFVSSVTGGGGRRGEEAFSVEKDMPFSQKACLNAVESGRWPAINTMKPSLCICLMFISKLSEKLSQIVSFMAPR